MQGLKKEIKNITDIILYTSILTLEEKVTTKKAPITANAEPGKK
jgi:hypothetical protein